jgi:large subunit ribosomal protein L28
MAHACFFTGKKTETGWKRSEKGARRNGGVGNKIKGRSKRKVKSNLKRLKIVVDGVVRTEWVSTRAIKTGLVVKPTIKKAVKA